MHFFSYLVMVVQILSAIAIVGLVLVQHGKGADMGAAFGSGSSGSLFGASGSANFLSHTTAVLAALFFASTLALTYLSSHKQGMSVGLLNDVNVPVVTQPIQKAPATNTSKSTTEQSSSSHDDVPQ